jgi:CHAD domain-containing protein
MAFCFKRKESVGKAVARLGCERIENGLECLKDCSQAEAIHCVRKDIKKARAVLRLAREHLRRKDFRHVGKLLRDAASELAGPRDAYVKAQTLRRLAQEYKGQLSAGAFRHIRVVLRKASDDEVKRFVREGKKKSVERILRRAAREFGKVKVRSKGWDVIGARLKASYSGGRRAYVGTVKRGSSENFHEWRKRVKDLWYHVSLLQPIWPEQMDAMAKELEELGEFLGNDHDLFVLCEFVRDAKELEKATARERELLKGLIEKRQSELRASSLALGRRFYIEKPSVFCGRLEKYWQAWRREEKVAIV